MRLVAFPLIVAAVAVAGGADAADLVAPSVPAPEAVEVRDIILDLGLGAALQPTFPSSKEYEVVPWPIFDLKFLRLPILGEVVDGKVRAISIYPSFGWVGERNQDDASYLVGTDDVDASFELGPGISYQAGWVKAFAEVRYGITGHNGFVADFGIDVTTSPLANFTISAGPRLSLADDAYMDAYFEVPAGAALPAYNPSAGLKDLGLALETTYAVTEAIRIRGAASWRHYVGDAADSPIVKAGNDNDFTVGIGLTYRFGLDLY
jgi:outer membrane scaffolding protein for murein synthesis (MipA/OmpV family)